MGLIAFGVIGFLVRNLRRSSKYISHGMPVVLRILSVLKRPTMELHGQSIYATCIMVECQDPRSGQTIQREIKTDSKDVPFRTGDYVTGIYFPDDFETTLQIYSLLGFHRKDGLSDSSYEWWLGIKMVTLVCSILAVPVFCLFVFARWFIRDPWTLMTLWGIGALVFGIPTAWLWHRTYRRKDIQRQQRNLHAITEGGILEQLAPPRAGFIGTGRLTGSALFFGVLMGMGIVFLSLALTINGGLDSSKPKDVPVSIVDIRVTTRKMIIREYELGYRLANDNETYHLHTTPDHLRQFKQGDQALAVIRDGFLSWEWVETIKKK
jgi:hypothetical protein